MTAREVAAYFRCSQSNVYGMVSRGTLPAIRLGALLRFDPEVVRQMGRTDRVASERSES